MNTGSPGKSIDKGTSIAVDSQGNVYVLGHFANTATFGQTTLTSSSGALSDIFLAKLDNDGNWKWVQHIPTTRSGEAYGLALDRQGNLYITGTFIKDISFGTLSLSGSWVSDIFVAQANPQGKWNWAKRFHGNGNAKGRGISVDSVGNAYVVGEFNGTLQVGQVTLSSKGNTDVFVLKLGATGTLSWATSGGGTGLDTVNDVAVDNVGNVYVTGAAHGNATFGMFPFRSKGQDNPFVAKIATNGRWSWMSQVESTGRGRGNGIVVNQKGEVFVVGEAEQTISIGSTSLTSRGKHDLFVAKLDANGGWLWSQIAGSTGDEVGSDIQLDTNGAPYITGTFQSSLSFGVTTLVSKGSDDLFLLGLDTNGKWVSWKRAGGSSHTDRPSLFVDAIGNMYLSGGYSGVGSTFGSHILSSQGSGSGRDVFLWKTR